MSDQQLIRLEDRISKLEGKRTLSARFIKTAKDWSMVGFFAAAIVAVIMYLMTKGQLDRATTAVGDLTIQIEHQKKQLDDLSEKTKQAQELAERLGRADRTRILQVLDVVEKPEMKDVIDAGKIEDDRNAIAELVALIQKTLKDQQKAFSLTSTTLIQLTTEKEKLAKQVARIYLDARDAEKQTIIDGLRAVAEGDHNRDSKAAERWVKRIIAEADALEKQANTGHVD